MGALWEELSGSTDSSCRSRENTHIRASKVEALRTEMNKWVFGRALAIEKVAQLELHSKDKYIEGNHDAYENLWDDFHDLHDAKAIGADNRRRDGVTLREVVLLYREVQTALAAGENEYGLRHPRLGLNRLDSDRRALR